MQGTIRKASAVTLLIGTAAVVLVGAAAFSQTATVTKPATVVKPPFPPHSGILNGYEKVVSTADGQRSLYTVYVKKAEGKMLAELPSSYATQKHFIAMTIASGERMAGLQAGDLYVYWKRYDKRLALIEPNLGTRSTGDPESVNSVKRLFTDRVILDVPILTMGPQGGPVIDMQELLVKQATKFFGTSVRSSNPNLVAITKAKAFPQNVELAFEIPTSRGRLQSLHYSISLIPAASKYKTRKADERVGFFTTSYADLGKYSDDDTRVRYINRWFLEKRDPELKISPPVKPIEFYLEHTTPVRYRRWVEKGILYWNAAFEKVGIANAIRVHHQDSRMGAVEGHMDKDPEDVRWNFIRWLNNDVGTAIGPSRVNPMTGEILDADVILTDGWIRHYRQQFEEIMPDIAMEGVSTETLAWLAKHPHWDPRIRLAPPARRDHLTRHLAKQGALPHAGHPMSQVDATLMGDDRFDGLIGRTCQINGLCLAAQGKAFDVAVMRMWLTMMAEQAKDEKKGEEKDEEKKDDKKKDEEKKDEAKKDSEPKEPLIDGMPESFIGPLLAELVAHEVGHTLGLRHNFKGSAIYTLAEINSKALKGKKPLAGSLMDYLPVNMNMKAGEVQGDYTMLGIGPYDMWAIEYGYSFEKDLKPILDRVAEPELAYATDENTSGPDPLARRYDFSKEPLDFAQNQMRIARHNRGQIIEKFVEKGDSWSKARRGYELTLSLQMRAVSMMANWIGGSFVYRDKKGDKNERVPIEVVPAHRQREALKFVIANTFLDEPYGLTPELLSRMTVDKWLDDDGFMRFDDEPTWPVHDRIMGMQASVLTMLMNPTTLRRVYDNEFRVPANEDAVTLPEVLQAISAAIWSELKKAPAKQYTARVPLISSLRRNLQQEQLGRLIELAMPGNVSTEAYKPIANLALMELKSIRTDVQKTLKTGGAKLDPYTRSHLMKIDDQITKALEAEFIYNANEIGGGSSMIFMLGQEADSTEPKD